MSRRANTETRPATRFEVAPVADIPPGERRILTVGGKSIGVFNLDGEFYAIRNRCPHQGGPLCLGPTTGLSTARFNGDAPPEREWERYGEIIRCPWHAWEFDLKTGQAVFGQGQRVATYRAYVEDHGDAPAGSGLRPGGIPGPVDTYRTTVEAGIVMVEIPR
jgi:nitrite reductase/ring-hydroxylating ferredoxin subunit